MTPSLVEFFELTLKPCTRTYGTSPCTAAVGTTGPYKCYNSPATCQDAANYLAGEQVVRWVSANSQTPQGIDAIPSLAAVSIRPQEIKPGESLGVREEMNVSFTNHPHSDAGFDKYLSTRGFNPYLQGTFWRKFAARWPNIKGFECALIRGTTDQPLSAMERRHYVVDSTAGPTNNGGFSITAKDAIKFLDDDKAMAPAVSPGSLYAAITDTATSLGLVPAGIGASDYPASGLASIGDEAVSFTRSGDTITLTGRALFGSKLGSHNAGDTFQLALVYTAAEVSDIINSLLGYSGLPADYYDYARWSDETTVNLGMLFSASIMKPTGVRTLLNELVQQAGLVVWTDTVIKKIRIEVLRAVTPINSYDDGVFLQGSLSASTDFDKHKSNILFYYGQKNPLEKIDEPKNYSAVLNQFAIQAEDVLEDMPLATASVYSRWVPVASSVVAEHTCDLFLARYGTAPKTLNFTLPNGVAPVAGSVVNIQSRVFEDPQGAMAAPMPFFLTRVEPALGHYKVKAEQLNLPATGPSGLRRIYINDYSYNLNLKTLHDSIYTPAVSGNSVLFIIDGDALLGATSPAELAVYNPAWASGVTVTLEFRSGRVQGAGGVGGYLAVAGVGYQGGISGQNAHGPGGPAFKTDGPITLVNPVIWGGGGGGKVGFVTSVNTYSRGGGGAGRNPGYGATALYGSPGTASEYANRGGAGGGPGQPGLDASGATNGGAAGYAIQGYSLCTITGTSDIRGPTTG